MNAGVAEQAAKLFGVLYDVQRELKDLDGQARLRIRCQMSALSSWEPTVHAM